MILQKFYYFGNLHTYQSDFFLRYFSHHTHPLSKKLYGTEINISLYALLLMKDISSGCISQQQASSQKAHWHITIKLFGIRDIKVQDTNSPCPSFHYWWIHWGFHGFVWSTRARSQACAGRSVFCSFKEWCQELCQRKKA